MFKVIIANGLVILLGATLWGTAVATGLALLLLAGWFLWIALVRASVRVPELAVGVVYRRDTRSFLRFLPPGHHWMLPFWEEVPATISTAPVTASGRCDGLQISGGITLNLAWTVSYGINPFRISAAMAPKLARTLSGKSMILVTKHMHNVLQHILDEYTMEQLTAPGVYKRLERQVRQVAAVRLAPFGLEVNRVMIGAIELPEHVRAALEDVQQRKLAAENEASTLARLQLVVSQFSERDMQRLLELERIQRLGQNGVTLVYPHSYEAAPAPRWRHEAADDRWAAVSHPFGVPAQ